MSSTAEVDMQSPAPTACAEVELSGPASALLDDHLTARAFIDRLATEKYTLDAIRVLARVLPAAHAVEWASACVRSLGDDALDETQRSLLDIAGAWLADPSENRREAAREAAIDSGFAGAAAWVAAAVAWGAAEPPLDSPADLSAGGRTGRAVAGAILIAATRDPEQIQTQADAFLARGLAIADR